MKTNNSYMERINGLTKHVGPVARFSNVTGNDDSLAPTRPRGLDQFSRTLVFVITNASNVSGTWVILGNNIYGDGANAGSDPYVTVTLTQSSHPQIKRSLDAQPTQLTTAKFKSTGDASGVEDNFSANISFIRQPYTGGRSADFEIAPENYQEPENLTQNLVRIPDFDGMDLDGDTYLTGVIAAGTTIRLILTIGSKVHLGNANANASVVSMTDALAPSGTKPIQMVIANAGK